MMMTEEKRNYRPKIHFTPLNMWVNDPNGMVYVDGTYHLFYQHYPEAPVWGTMHWGHGISKDLLNWEHLPVALYPDELGSIFSGSCVYDVLNTSGLGTKEKPPMIALFTSHNEESGTDHQSLAYSTDYVHFEKYYGNPVIKNPGIKDFRDPKVFHNSLLNCWSLVLAAGDRVRFYKSKNLREWEETGEFVTGGNGIKGICECPDCFPVETKEGIKWMLIISMIVKEGDAQYNKTQYYVGTFDGQTFQDTEQAEGPLWLDYGTDHYAGVTFQNLDKPVLIGWADNWAYADKVPTKEYRGQMSIPCEVSLKNTPKGYRAALNPLGLEPLKAKSFPVGNRVQLKSQSFGLEIKGKGKGKITLSNSYGRNLVIDISEKEITVDRRNADSKEFSETYALLKNSLVKVKRYQKEDYQMIILFDVSLLEVFAEEGLLPVTMSVYPEDPYDTLSLDGDIIASMFLL